MHTHLQMHVIQYYISPMLCKRTYIWQTDACVRAWDAGKAEMQEGILGEALDALVLRPPGVTLRTNPRAHINARWSRDGRAVTTNRLVLTAVLYATYTGITPCISGCQLQNAGRHCSHSKLHPGRQRLPLPKLGHVMFIFQQECSGVSVNVASISFQVQKKDGLKW